MKQIVGSTLRDSNDDGTKLVTNFVSDKSAAEFANMYKEDGLTGGHLIMLGADHLSKAATIEALHAYPGTYLPFEKLNFLLFLVSNCFQVLVFTGDCISFVKKIDHICYMFYAIIKQ